MIGNKAHHRISLLLEKAYQIGKTKKGIIWFVWTLALSVFFVLATTVNLANYRVVTADDVWIMSVSYKLARQGILGSDLYAGFFNAEQHYFISLPFYHFLQALSFKLAGVGIAQARYVNVLSAVGLLWAVSWLSYRWYGVKVALVTGLLIVFWRSYLVGGGYYGYGNALLEVARAGRYDLPALTLIWLTIVGLDKLHHRPHWLTAFAVGIGSGLAALTQFFGLFVFPLVVAMWGWHNLPSDPKTRSLSYNIMLWISTGFLLTLLPYGLYLANHAADAASQTLVIKQNRAEFNQFNFYLDNLRREPYRYIWAGLSPQSLSLWPVSLNRPFGLGPALLLAGIWPSLIYLGYRLKRQRRVGDRIVLFGLVIFFALLTLLEATKAPIYSILFLPPLCIALAAGWVDLVHWWNSGKARHFLAHWALAGLIIGIPTLAIIEGMGGYWIDYQQAIREMGYLEAGREIKAYLAPNARILSAERWWWALHDHPYLSTNNLFGRWVAHTDDNDETSDFADMVRQIQIDTVIVNDNVRDGLPLYPQELQRQFQQFLADCGSLVTELTFENYGFIEIYHIRQGC